MSDASGAVGAGPGDSRWTPRRLGRRRAGDRKGAAKL